ncbi:hypothetical protein [Thermoactinomyces sp. CICC 10521]|uniref:hypothetical protein n=1 Tax=Thermoactinomyces sp. CICC 10521 TaxID=2767426 RepID=UPI0018DC0CE7|nr:hypothetical protein [Thermoactinomyces sp. CICC 10521]MBH8608570.1 hypothetical protein [Thermoactinomyces sp. CICC 10521]
MSKLTDYCQFEQNWAIYEIVALENQLDNILSVLGIPYNREAVVKKFEEAWESEEEYTDILITHPDDKNIFLLYHISFATPDYDYLIIRGKKQDKEKIQRVFVEEWNRTSHPKRPFYQDVDKYFGDRIESGISIIEDIIVDKSLDIEWIGINED